MDARFKPFDIIDQRTERENWREVSAVDAFPEKIMKYEISMPCCHRGSHRGGGCLVVRILSACC